MAALIARSFATRFAWLTMTPFAVLVEPEVYCRKAIVVPSMSMGAFDVAALLRIGSSTGSVSGVTASLPGCAYSSASA
ncbi:hypothetical protein R69746_04099 [Paraburkholderia aspalathi]|nr:hypothetical protein R69746_04099 [Paraburkholderia aspalathi]